MEAQIFPASILLVTDGSREATLAAEAAVELANGTGSELHAMHVVSTVPEMPYPRRFAKERTEALLEAKKLHALTLLDKRVVGIEKLGGKVAGSHYREGKPDEEVIRLSEELDVGLVIMGDRSQNWFERAFARSFSERVLSRANRPVLVVREPVSPKRKSSGLR
jgi:nucleotide-binding universal stress UspA family protein